MVFMIILFKGVYHMEMLNFLPNYLAYLTVRMLKPCLMVLCFLALGDGLLAEDGDVPRSERILRDGYFFEQAFAERQLAKLGEIVEKKDREFFSTTGRFAKKPKLNEIIRRYGDPDLVVATKDFYLKGAEQGSYTVTAYFDRVGFSVYGKHQRTQTIHLVTTQYHDFSRSLRPKTGKYFYEIVTTRNRVFFSDGEEVGLHVYTDREKWTTLGEIPAGEYKSVGQDDPYASAIMAGDESGVLKFFHKNGGVRKEIEFAKGKYEGVLKEYSDQGWVSSEAHYKDGRMHGKMKRFYENGMKQAEANYYHGRIHGKAQEFHPNGSVRLNMEYSYGKPVTDLQEFDESGKLVRTAKAAGS